MAIGNAVQRASHVSILDEGARQIATIPTGSAPGDGLKGYTSGTVTVQQGPFIHTYDERGHQISITAAR